MFRTLSFPSVGFAALLLSALLTACTPALDWREVRNEEGGYRALFPAKPVVASREFVLAGQTVTLKLQAATSGSSYFAVGEIPLSEAQQASADSIVNALKLSLKNNVGATDSTDRNIVAGGVVWQEVRASGQLKNGKPSVMAGRFLVQPGRILEVLVMGERAELTDEAIDMWLGGLKLGAQP